MTALPEPGFPSWCHHNAPREPWEGWRKSAGLPQWEGGLVRVPSHLGPILPSLLCSQTFGDTPRRHHGPSSLATTGWPEPLGPVTERAGGRPCGGRPSPVRPRPAVWQDARLFAVGECWPPLVAGGVRPSRGEEQPSVRDNEERGGWVNGDHLSVKTSTYMPVFSTTVTEWKDHTTRRAQNEIPRRVDFILNKVVKCRVGCWGEYVLSVRDSSGWCLRAVLVAVLVGHTLVSGSQRRKYVSSQHRGDPSLPSAQPRMAYLAAGEWVSAVADQPVMSGCRCSSSVSRATLMCVRDVTICVHNVECVHTVYSMYW